METITIRMLKEDVIPIIEMYMFNIFELKERQTYSDEDLDISYPLELYNQELNKLKPVLEELDYVKNDLELIYEYNFKSSTEVDYGNLTKNGSNNLLIKIFKLK